MIAIKRPFYLLLTALMVLSNPLQGAEVSTSTSKPEATGFFGNIFRGTRNSIINGITGIDPVVLEETSLEIDRVREQMKACNDEILCYQESGEFSPRMQQEVDKWHSCIKACLAKNEKLQSAKEDSVAILGNIKEITETLDVLLQALEQGSKNAMSDKEEAEAMLTEEEENSFTGDKKKDEKCTKAAREKQQRIDAIHVQAKKWHSDLMKYVQESKVAQSMQDTLANANVTSCNMAVITEQLKKDQGKVMEEIQATFYWVGLICQLAVVSLSLVIVGQLVSLVGARPRARAKQAKAKRTP